MKQFLIIVFSLICFSALAQQPTTLPSVKSDSGFYQIGYVRPMVLDHGAVGDTMIRPKYSGAHRYWMRTGPTRVEDWVWNGSLWLLVTGNGSGSGTVSTFSYTDTYALAGVVTNPTTTPNLTVILDTSLVTTRRYVDSLVNAISGGDSSTFVFEAPISGVESNDSIYVSHDVSGVTAGSYTNLNATIDAYGHITAASNGSGGAGTVSSFSAGNLSPLFTSSVATATTTPALTFALTNATAWQTFARHAGTTGAPSYGQLVAEHLNTTYSNGNMLITNGSGTLSWTTAGTVLNGTGYVLMSGTTPSYVPIIPVIGGGTGTSTPSLVAGTNITSITGTWPNQTINASGGSGSYTPQYINILVSGQSNAWGASGPTSFDTAANSRVLIWQHASTTPAWVTARINQKPFRSAGYNSGPLTGGPDGRTDLNGSANSAFYLAKKLATENPYDTVRIVMAIGDGASISYWFSGVTKGQYTDSITTRGDASGIDHVDVFIWDQGESDGTTPEATYIRSFDSLKATLRREPWFALATPIVASGLPQAAYGATVAFTYRDTTLKKFDYDNDVWVGYGNTDSLSIATDNIHWSAGSLDTLGILKYYQAWKALPYRNIERNNALTGSLTMDSVAIKRYGNVYASNYRGFNSGGRTAAAQFIASSSAVAADSANILIGYLAGDSLTTAAQSTFIGNSAGRKHSTGYGNVGVGSGAYASNSSVNSTGVDNVAIGRNSLTVNQSGSRNVGIGTFSLNSSVAAADNIAIGYEAMKNSTGSSNVGIGYQALSNSSASIQNVGIGYQALSSATGGSNIGVGPFAGGAITTGTKNIVMSTNTAAGDISGAASNNVSIGKFSGTANDRVMLGNSTGASSPGAGTVAIGGTASSIWPLSTLTPTNGVYIGPGVGYTHSGGGSPASTVIIGALSGFNITGSTNTVVGGSSLNTAAFNSASIAAANNTILGFNNHSALTGTPTYNIGIGSSVQPISASGSSQFAMGGNSIRWMISDLTGSSSTRRWTLNGTAANITATDASAALEVRSTTGGFMPPVMTGAQATTYEGTTPSDGNIIYVSSTNGTFTSVGIWCKIAGTWTALHL